MALKKSIVECKVSYSISVCIAICHAHIMYVHSKSYRVCIQFGVHDHPCHESLDVAYECTANEAIKTPTKKKSRSDDKKINKFSFKVSNKQQRPSPCCSRWLKTILVHSPPWFVISLCLDRNDLCVVKWGWWIMSLKSNLFLGSFMVVDFQKKSKDRVFVLKMWMNLLSICVELMKHMQVCKKPGQILDNV